MGYLVDWYVPDQILYVSMSDHLTLDEVKHGNQEVIHYFDQSSASQVHLLVNNSNLRNFPTNLTAIMNSTLILRHRRCGWTVSYDQVNNRMIEMISSIMYRVFNMRRHSAASLSEALRILKEKASDVDWDQANNALVYEPASNGPEK